MARTKTIVKEHILDASLDLLTNEGFKHFTARRVAKTLNCSTQPIYKEFSSMDDLKDSLVERIKQYLSQEVFKQESSSNKIVDFCKNYIRFAQEQSVLFSAIFLDREFDTELFHSFSVEELKKEWFNEKEKETLSQEEEMKIEKRLWPAIHGTATLVAQEVVDYTDEELDGHIEALLSHTE